SKNTYSPFSSYLRKCSIPPSAFPPLGSYEENCFVCVPFGRSSGRRSGRSIAAKPYGMGGSAPGATPRRARSVAARTNRAARHIFGPDSTGRVAHAHALRRCALSDRALTARPDPAYGRAMSTIEKNLALVRRFWDDLYAHEFARLGAYFTEN